MVYGFSTFSDAYDTFTGGNLHWNWQCEQKRA